MYAPPDIFMSTPLVEHNKCIPEVTCILTIMDCFKNKSCTSVNFYQNVQYVQHVNYKICAICKTCTVCTIYVHKSVRSAAKGFTSFKSFFLCTLDIFIKK